MADERHVTREEADGLLSEWAEQAQPVVLVVFRGEPPDALITFWNGTLEVESEGGFRHMSGNTANFVMTAGFAEIVQVEEGNFPGLCLRRGVGVSRLTVLL